MISSDGCRSSSRANFERPVKDKKGPGPDRGGAKTKSMMRKAPGASPCAFLDEVDGKKGYRIALFDVKTDEFRYYLVSDGKASCGMAKTEEGATVYKTIQDVEKALNTCSTLPCPPCDCEMDPKGGKAGKAEKPEKGKA